MFVPGGNLSLGDLHFSQGDGEITFCGAIEMDGFVDLRVEVISGGMETYGVTTNPFFMPGNVEPRYSEFMTSVGISVNEDGEQHYLDSDLAYRRACLNAIAYLTKFGYTPEEAYLILGAAPIESGCRAWWTSRTPARPCTCRQGSSTSTSGRPRRAPGRRPGPVRSLVLTAGRRAWVALGRV